MILGGKMEPYSKRCTATKLTSAEKLMYICKNQLGKLLISYSNLLHNNKLTTLRNFPEKMKSIPVLQKGGPKNVSCCRPI